MRRPVLVQRVVDVDLYDRYYKERDRQRQERELKEGKEAIAREIAERNRKAGWG